MEGKPETTRLFVALWPDDAIRDLLREWRDLWSWPRPASPVATEKLHVTLHFLGSLPSERVPDLVQGLQVPFSPFVLDLGRPKLWPHGIAVLEPLTEPDQLLRLHADLGQALVALGLEPEARKFRPHVTMARRAADAIAPPAGPPVSWDVQGYALVQSLDGQYTVLKHYG